MGGNTLHNRTKIAALLLALGLMSAACGTRLPDSSFETAAARSTATTSASDSLDLGDTDNGTTDTVPGETSTGGDTGTGSNGPSKSGTGGPSGGATGPVGGAVSGPNQACDIGITATTITLGNITAENGVLGDAFAPAVRGMRAWTAAINAKGGINGRKVILKTCDDREDRARDLACAQQLVERDKVFALVGDEHARSRWRVRSISTTRACRRSVFRSRTASIATRTCGARTRRDIRVTARPLATRARSISRAASSAGSRRRSAPRRRRSSNTTSTSRSRLVTRSPPASARRASPTSLPTR